MLNRSIGLSPQAGHPASQLHVLHGSLFDIKCSSYCDYYESNNFTDPIVPALALPKGANQPAALGTATSGAAATASMQDAMKVGWKELDISDDRIEIPELRPDDLPQCPKCGNLLRPGVVWFGESLPTKTMNEIDRFIFEEADKIDLILVIGTSAKVFPAAAYVETARTKGAQVAVINMDPNDIPAGEEGLQEGDWFFQGDAARILPEILKGEIGDI